MLNTTTRWLSLSGGISLALRSPEGICQQTPDLSSDLSLLSPQGPAERRGVGQPPPLEVPMPAPCCGRAGRIQATFLAVVVSFFSLLWTGRRPGVCSGSPFSPWRVAHAVSSLEVHGLALSPTALGW